MQSVAVTLVSGMLVASLGILGEATPAVSAEPDWKAVEQALGKSGQLMPGDVYRIGMPRTDLSVTVKGVPVRAGFALGSYAAFKQIGDHAMVMGDLVLLDQEVPTVMSGLFASGLEVTAVHNHLNEMSPHVMYMHYGGHGDAVELAKALRQALSASATPLGSPPPAPVASGGPTLDAKAIEQALGRSGRDVGSGVFQVTVPRAAPVTERGVPLLPAMGVATVLNFQPTGVGTAAITGDFVLVDSEVNAVARALRQHGIDVTAIHNHALQDTPRLFYMHFWANDDLLKLAAGLKAALDQTNSQRAQGGELRLPAGAPTERLSFEQTGLEGWRSVGGQWTVEEMSGAPSGKRVLVQRALRNSFNVIVAPGGPYQDVDVSVRFRPISGREDASGGIVFRFAGGRYYVIRANALENNFRLYAYEGGRRQLASATVEPPAFGQWHTMRVVAVGDHVQGYLDGKLLIDHRDGRFRAGQVGLWTKADSITAFDDLIVQGVKIAG